MSEQGVQQLRTVLDFQRVLALVGHQRAHIDREILFVGQRRYERQHQSIILGRLEQIGGQFVQRTHAIRHNVLAVVVLQWHFIEIFVAPLLVAIVFVILFRVSVIVFAQKMDFLISIQVSHVNLLQCHRCIHTLGGQAEFRHQIFPFVAVIYLAMYETPFTIVEQTEIHVSFGLYSLWPIHHVRIQLNRIYANRFRDH